MLIFTKITIYHHFISTFNLIFVEIVIVFFDSRRNNNRYHLIEFYFLVHSLKLITAVTNSLKEIDQEKIAIIVFQGCKSIYEEATN